MTDTTVAANVCVATGCGIPGPPEPWQVELPAERQRLLAKASLLDAEAKALRDRAADVARRIAKAAEAEPQPFLCRAHRTHLHDPALRHLWAGGQLVMTPGDDHIPEAIAKTVDYLDRRIPGSSGACLDCRV